MNKNENILSIIRQKQIILIISIFLEIATIIFTMFFLTIMSNNFQNEPFINYFKIIFLTSEVIFYVFLNIFQTINISKIKTLINVEPIKCTIEDLVIIRKDRKNI